LTLEQAENVFALSAGESFSRVLVEREKMRLIRSEYMSVEKPRDVSVLAGLGQLKSYITDEVLPARDDEQLQVRGICLIGVPGTGKSLSARVMAGLLEWPLVRFDISAAKGSLVGQSESNIRKALATADAISPCVLWLDEIEKAVGGHASSAATDGGTTLAMVGTLLTWMQEHTSPVLVIATCNDYAKLPPEMTRAGRFDEKFFLDLPSSKEREGIATVHLKALSCEVGWADAIASMAEDWTGAEIEQLIKSTARQTKRKLSLEMLEKCKEQIIPISKTASIKTLREWAAINLRRANDLEEVPTATRKSLRHMN
jgi:SpoVK/Ycf46/Vps4 family AAA+-type ATPase